MTHSSYLKKIVREKYSRIVKDNTTCCGQADCNDKSTFQLINENYVSLDGYVSEADLQLGCGIPTEYSEIQRGQTVVDLGSGAGNDAFIARSLVGDTGWVIGIDMTEKMVLKAMENLKASGYKNIEFKLGDIESIPLEENTADVVISNCVLNLVPDKQKAFDEIYRILKPGGHFCISDIVSTCSLPQKIQEIAALYTGCISGAMELQEYLNKISCSGFISIQIKATKKLDLSPEQFNMYLNPKEQINFPNLHDSFRSITVFGIKPL